MTTNPLRVVLVDDQELVRAGVRKVLEGEPDMAVVGEANDGDEMMRLLRTVEADVVVLDLNMPGRDGFEALRDLHMADLSVRVLVLSLHDDPQYVGRAVREGAHGYLLKDCAVQELPIAVRAVMQGRPFFSPRAQEALTQALRNGQRFDPVDLLSPRELELTGVSVTEEVEVAVYRVVQEALTNVARHSGAKRARVKATHGAGGVEVVIEDDGKGAIASPTPHMGLLGMRERVTKLGGRFRVVTRPQQGFRIEATLPQGVRG